MTISVRMLVSMAISMRVLVTIAGAVFAVSMSMALSARAVTT